MEELQKRHRQEQRDLIGRITQKKKNATKKTRKGINDECAGLEAALKERQQQELDALAGVTPADGTDGLDRADDAEGQQEQLLPVSASNDTDSLPRQIRDLSDGHDAPAPAAPSKKPNRHKARLARRAAEQDALAAAAADEAANMPDRRAQEQEAMGREMAARGLVEHAVRSDGHCLYAAVADQLAQYGRPVGTAAADNDNAAAAATDGELPAYRDVRRATAAFVERHPDDFAPFLEEPLAGYVAKIRDTGEWGGQLELSALARVYGLEIRVLQSDGRVESIGSGSSSAEKGLEIWLAYYRHSFGLGEHYNSLRKQP